MVRAFVTRLPFRVAVALVAAAIADPFVESISNTGIFGGHFHDDNHLGVIPTMFACALLLLELLILRFIDVWRGSAHRSRTLADFARGLTPRSFARDLPYVFAFQLAVVFGMENAEQLAVSGHFVGDATWLGGPIAFSLIAHGLIGACCAFVLGTCMRKIVEAFHASVAGAIRFMWLAIPRAVGSAFDIERRNTQCRRARTLHVRQIGGRAPPLRIAST